MPNAMMAGRLIRNMTPPIRRALFEAAESILEPRVGSCTMSVEMFLSALECLYGKLLLRQFQDPNAFLRMRQECMPHYQRMNPIQRFLKRTKMPSWGVMFDNELRDLLWNAVRIATASGRTSTGLPEVMAALCLNDKLIADLKQNRGIMPIQYLERLPLGPDYFPRETSMDKS